MIDFTQRPRYGFDDLVRLVALLRAPGGCPWDGAQTHLSIRRNFLEEAYEACEGFDADDPAKMCEELGDVLLQVVFHADLERAAGRFTMEDVCDGVCKKLIFRHPALFSDTGEAPSWEALKRQEKGLTTTTQALEGVAASLPALWRSEKVQKKAASTGFAWESAEDCLGKLEEEAEELRRAADGGENVAEELGDVLFAAVSAAVYFKIDPEQALHAACEKFIGRFARMEQTAAAQGQSLGSLPRSALLALWTEAKHERGGQTFEHKTMIRKEE